jgi:citrate synthase
LSAFHAALPLARDADSSAHDLRPTAVRQAGGRIIRLLTALVAGRDREIPLHLTLQSAWAPKNRAAGEAIRGALVLSADHELNVSAFVARCAASAGASAYDTVAAALATLRGFRHGGATERVAALFAETEKPNRARVVVAGRMRRGEGLPGFGHPLYPGGDPRAKLLLEWADRAGNPAERRLTAALCNAASHSLQELPNLDFGLVALARAYQLPENAPLVLFALGRTAGWIAHSIEQYATAELIRPRARYTGPPPIG